MVKRLLAALAVLALAGVVWSDDGPKPACQNAVAINWITPGNFEVARERAEKENRLLMIKGIAFGIDEEGAKCATKGCW